MSKLYLSLTWWTVQISFRVLGDANSAKLFADVDRLVRDLLVRYCGQEIDRTDGFLTLFDRPADAVSFSVDFHRSLASLGDQIGSTLKSHVGIHVGDVVLRKNSQLDISRGAKAIEVEGLSKPLTARLMSMAVGGQTLLTRTAYELVNRSIHIQDVPQDSLRWEYYGRFSVKGVSEPIDIYEFGITNESPFVKPLGSNPSNKNCSLPL